jgi:uncharacterized protein (UPF0335 family)
LSDASATSTRMGFVEKREADGTKRLVWGVLPPSKPKGKKARPQPDPIIANPDATGQQLKQFVERIERLEEEKRGICDDISDVYSEVKSHGYDAKITRKIVELRRMDGHDRAEMETVLDLYKSALGIE